MPTKGEVSLATYEATPTRRETDNGTETVYATLMATVATAYNEVRHRVVLLGPAMDTLT